MTVSQITAAGERLSVIDGAANRDVEDDQAYAELADACNRLLTTLYLSDQCASSLRRCERAARRCAGLPVIYGAQDARRR